MENWNPRYQDCYFTPEEGAAESRHVFYCGCGLDVRLPELLKGPDDRFAVLETGFGTGLNCFLSAILASGAGCRGLLEFWSVDEYPLGKAEILQLLSPFFDAHPQLEPVVQAYPDKGLGPGWNQWEIGLGQLHCRFRVFAGDVADFVLSPELSSCGARALFLDGHSPEKNPRMWSAEVFRGLRRGLTSDARGASFTASGLVKRGLREAGFRVKRTAGYGRKRHMIVFSPHVQSATGAEE